jgi:hypothetical protein
VRAVSDFRGRPRGQRSLFVRCVEDELDHLPVAFVRVVEVVERIEEPVLQGELAGAVGLAGDVRVDGGRRAFGQSPRPALVVAAGVERVAGEVEVVLVAVDEVGRGRADLHQVALVPGTAKGDGRLAEQQVDVGRLVRLPGSALLGLVDEPHRGGVLLGQRRLAGEVRGRRTAPGEGAAGDDGEESEPVTATMRAPRHDGASSHPGADEGLTRS